MVTYTSLLKAAPILAAAFLPNTQVAEARQLRLGGLSVFPIDVSNPQLFYPDADSKTCLNDGNGPEDTLYLFEDLGACCQAYFWGDVQGCMGLEPLNERKSGRRKLKDNHSANPGIRALHHGKSGKSSKSNKSGKYYYKPPSKNNNKHHHHHHGKSGKGSKSVHMTPVPPHRHPATPKPTNRPTGKPVSPPQNPVLISMDGSLIAMDLDVPAAGSDDIEALAGVFEKTIIRALDKGYLCDVNSIGGIPVSDGSLFRNLQTVSSTEVLFTLRTIRPCPDCDNTGALLLGAQVFDEAFETLDEKAKSGELSVIFCIFAEVEGLVEEPCTVSITSVEGESLDVEFVDDDSGTPITPTPPTGGMPGGRPTAKPVAPPTPTPVTPTPAPVPDVGTKPPTDPPVMEWPPTPAPYTIVDTEPPVKITLPPVVPTNPPVVTTPSPMEVTVPPAVEGTTETPTVFGELPPVVPTNPPVVPTSAPMEGTMPPTVFEELPPVVPTNPPVVPTSAPMEGTMPPTVAGTTGTPTSSPTGEATSHSPSASPSGAATSHSPSTMPSSLPTTGSTTADSSSSPSSSQSLSPTTGSTGVSGMPTPGSSSNFTPSNFPTLSAEPTSSTYYPTSSPTPFEAGEPTSTMPTSSVGEPTSTMPTSTNTTTTAPTAGRSGSTPPTYAFPSEAIYIEGFEQATFPDDEEWSTAGEADWTLTTEMANTGLYSIRTGAVGETGVESGFSNVTFTTPEDFTGGTMFLSIMASTELPLDDCFYMVDGVFMGPIPPNPNFVTMDIPLLPGSHKVEFTYLYNPFKLDQFPPENPDIFRAVFIDDVYIMPDGSSVPPNMGPTPSGPPVGSSMPTSASFPSGSTSPNMEPTSTIPTTVPAPPSSTIPTPAAPSPGVSIPPTTAFPADSIYFDSFEQATFPDDDEWSTGGEAEWTLTNEAAHSGAYSIRSGVLNDGSGVPKNSNVTFTTGPDFLGGVMSLSVLSIVQLPIDDCLYFVDGNFGGIVPSSTEWVDVSIPLGPGEHTVMLSYKYNPLQQDVLPPPSGDYLGAVFVDDVYITSSDSSPTSSVPPTTTPSPTVAVGSTVPTPVRGDTAFPSSASSGSAVPTPARNGTTSGPTPAVEVGTPSPSVVSGLPPATNNLFDGFETGDFSAFDWTVSGVPGWVVDESKPYEGSYSASVTTEDILASGNYSQLDLGLNLEQAAFVQFYFNAPVAMPFESFDLWMDGNFLTPLTTPDGNWTQAGAIVAAGQHVMSWRYAKNPGGAPEDVLETLPQPPFRTGEAWLDNVELIPATSSFTEDWESGDFSSQPWVTSGDSSWEVTDSNASEGEYSATASSATIAASSGQADLSIDIITESGGKLYFAILASVAGPHDIVNVLIDDTIVSTYANVQEDWLPAELDIQPGKRQVTWQLIKNPGGLPDDVISTIPTPDGHLGQVWLDSIDFRSN